MNKTAKRTFSLCSVATVAALALSPVGTVVAKEEVFQPRIIGGEPTEPNRYPFMTGLIVYESESISPFCGASFIGGRYVLSASHCLIGEDPDDLGVWIGGHDIRDASGGRKVKVAQVYLHEDYDDSSLDNDIAILELVEEVEGIPAINLLTPEMEQTLADGFEFTVMGWGNTDTANPQYPDVLQEVQVPLYNREACQATYPELSDVMICAGLVEGGKDSCQGDSGGPLVFESEGQWYQAGVVSFGNGCAVADNPGVYARVSRFIDWVDQKKAGVSYRQFRRNGYVEQNFDEAVPITIKNVSQTAFSVTGLSVQDTNNLSPVTVVSNQCEGNELSFEQSCVIELQMTADRVGDGGFTLQLTTDHPGNQDVELYVSLNALEQEKLGVSDLVDDESGVVTWWGGGDASWQTQTTNVAEGNNAIESGDVSDFERSVLLATISDDTATNVSLKYLVSSEQNYDFLTILHNNKPVLRASGTGRSDFEDLTIQLADGTDRIAIVYGKDQSESAGDDKAYIDAVSVTVPVNQAPVAQVAQTSMSVEEESQFTLDASSSTDPEAQALTYAWRLVDSDSIQITDPNQAQITLTAPSVTTATDFVFEVTVTDTNNASSTAQVTVSVTPKPAPVTPTPAPTPPAQPTRSSGGSMGYLLGLLLLVVSARRKQ